MKIVFISLLVMALGFIAAYYLTLRSKGFQSFMASKAHKQLRKGITRFEILGGIERVPGYHYLSVREKDLVAYFLTEMGDLLTNKKIKDTITDVFHRTHTVQYVGYCDVPEDKDDPILRNAAEFLRELFDITWHPMEKIDSPRSTMKYHFRNKDDDPHMVKIFEKMTGSPPSGSTVCIEFIIFVPTE